VAVKIKLRVGRWRCRNAACKRRIFCQRLATVTRVRAQETNRFLEVVQLVGYALGGRPGEQLIARLGLPVSDDTLLRRIKQMVKSRPPSGPIPVVGVDDWAWRKSSRYGTILIDLQQREVADLLPERSADVFAQWLQQHPEVTTISRDRHGLYAEGARRGAPQAQQVADRFHLVQNLIEAMEGELAQQRHHLVCRQRSLWNQAAQRWKRKSKQHQRWSNCPGLANENRCGNNDDSSSWSCLGW
jgi:transposase